MKPVCTSPFCLLPHTSSDSCTRHRMPYATLHFTWIRVTSANTLIRFSTLTRKFFLLLVSSIYQDKLFTFLTFLNCISFLLLLPNPVIIPLLHELIFSSVIVAHRNFFCSSLLILKSKFWSYVHYCDRCATKG